MVSMFRSAVLYRLAAMMVFSLSLAACDGTTLATTDSAPATAGSSGATTDSSDPLTFSAAGYSVAQSDKSVTLTVVRTGVATNAASVDYATVDGTATAGSDYTAANGTLQWAENDATSRTITVPVSATTAFSGTKAFQVALSNPSASAALGDPDSATVTITGDSTVGSGSAEFSSATYSVNQNAGTVTFTVNRTGGAMGQASVAYATSNGTAVSGTDYTATSGVLQWTDGQAASKSFTVAISNASPFTGGKTFNVALSNPSAVTLATPSSASVTITGDAVSTVGSLKLSAASYTVAQGAGTVTMTVTRTGGSSGAVTVAYATTNGTALAGTDFTAAKGTLSWAAGDASAKTFTIPVSNANPFTGNKSFTLALSAASGGATISNPGTATVTIAGDLAAPVGSVALSAASYTVSQGAGTVTVTVNRSGGSGGAITAAYSTANGTAVAGADYTSTSGTLKWADADATAKSFTVPVSNATPFQGSKSFKVLLTNPSNGATLSTPNSATVSITGDATSGPGSFQIAAAKYAVLQSTATLSVTVNRTGGSLSIGQ